MKRDLARAVAAVEDEVIAIRRDLHMHPELSFRETRTAGLVAERLTALGLDVRTGVARTGVVGLLRGATPGKTVAIRADMDGIEGEEKIAEPYASKVQGVQHGCGHDAHVAMALGSAMVLAERRAELKGCVKFIFEPAEEVITEDDLTTGTELMVQEGVLDDVDAMLYFHVWPECEAGRVELSRGCMFSGWDMLTVRILGREHHGGTPEKGVDAIAVACQVVSALQTMLTRAISIAEPCSIHIGTMAGGRARNMVADCVEMTGSVRCADLELRKKELPERIERVISHVAAAYGAEFEMTYTDYLHPVVNSPETVDLVAGAIASAVGPDVVKWRVRPWMGGDSFYRYSERVPSCYGLLGCGNRALGTDFQTHHPMFDIDEACLRTGVLAQCASVLRYLGEKEVSRVDEAQCRDRHARS